MTYEWSKTYNTPHQVEKTQASDALLNKIQNITKDIAAKQLEKEKKTAGISTFRINKLKEFQ